MAISSQDSSPLFSGDGVGTFKLVIYIVMAILLMVSDQRGQIVASARRAASAMAGPAYQLASAPSRIFNSASVAVRERYQLDAQNKILQARVLVLQAQIGRLAAVSEQNTRLLQLLGARDRLGLKVQMARIIDLDLDPFRQRVMIDIGRSKGVEVGQAALDANGVFGQVSEVFEHRARLVLLTDPSHSIPVVFERLGLRGIAYGSGDAMHMRVSNLPNNAQLEIGDRVVTSGLGGRFPAGLSIGTIATLSQAEGTGLTEAKLVAAAGFSTSNELLLVHEAVQALKPSTSLPTEFVGPQVPNLPQAQRDLIVQPKPAVANELDAAIVPNTNEPRQ